MKSCKKYRAKAEENLYHARNTDGECTNCRYFSKANCRRHNQTPEGTVTSL